MIITRFDIYEYSLPLVSPFFVCGAEINERKGLILHICSDEGGDGFGEIAPLPGMSEESFDEALMQLNQIKQAFINQEIPEKVEKLNGQFAKWLDVFELKPSVQFGLEMAVMNLMANLKNKSLNIFISKSHHEKISINGLLQGDADQVVNDAKKLIQSGFSAMKLKVGSDDIDHDVKKVQLVNKAINGKALLHLDANKAWELDQAIEFGQKIGCMSVDYIEEPLKDHHDIINFFEATTIPSALDESLVNFNLDDLNELEGVDVLVLKPSILGGIEKTWMIIQRAQVLALSTVISSAFESGVGLITLAELAGSYARDYPAGLDTLKWFKQDILNDAFQINKGKIDITNQKLTPERINFNLLEAVK